MLRARTIVFVVLLLAAARAQAQPAPLPLLDVPYVSQSEALCGGAAAAMILRFWGERRISAETFAPLVDRSAAGIRTATLVAALTERGWRATATTGTDALRASELSAGRPVIALIEDRPRILHYVVIVGITERAVIFHDPARAPFRVIARDEFDRRWRATDRWMAVVLPPEAAAAPPASAESILPGARGESVPQSLRESNGAPTGILAAAESCEQRISRGVREAQANDLVAAERALTSALSCPGATASRELAGVRFLQRRWEDAAELATQAASMDTADAYAWQLLGTSRFLLDQPLAALDAWNHVGQPRLDLVRVDGLERTRQRPVERMLGMNAGQIVTPATFVRTERAFTEFPAARSTRLDLVPAGQGTVDLHATLVERGTLPRDALTWAVVGARAGVTRTVAVTLGSLSGAGESLAIEWRFWPHRPRIGISLRAPAAWTGIWGADVYGESQEFDGSEPESRRRGGRVMASRWISSSTRIEVRGGADRWNSTGTAAAFGLSAGILSAAERLWVRVATDGWAGSTSFGSFAGTVTASSAPRLATSRAVPLGPVVTVSGGGATVTRRAPLDLWPAGDTGPARAILARAHPVLDGGRMQVSRLGRSVLFTSGEGQYWWKAPGLARVGATAFIDLVRTMERSLDMVGVTAVQSNAVPALDDADIGVGLGIASLLVPGRFRVDYAHGLRDGADAITARYVVSGW